MHAVPQSFVPFQVFAPKAPIHLRPTRCEDVYRVGGDVLHVCYIQLLDIYIYSRLLGYISTQMKSSHAPENAFIEIDLEIKSFN